MTISTLAEYDASLRQRIFFFYTMGSSQSGVASGQGRCYQSLAPLGGVPAAMPSISNITSGVVPVAGDTGFPTLNSFSGSGYLSGARTVTQLITGGGVFGHQWFLYDRLWHAGPFDMSTNAGTTTFSAQPSYTSRLPASNASGVVLYAECMGGSSGSPTIAVGYTNQSGTSGRSTATTALGQSPYRFTLLPLQAGDSGVQKVDSVTIVAGGASVGVTANIVVVRPLFYGRCDQYEVEYAHPLDRVGLLPIYATSALAIAAQKDGDSSSLPVVCAELEIASA